MRKQTVDREWSEYPVGTKAHAVMGGHWTKTERGWKWCHGSTFPTPGGDALSVTLPEQQEAAGDGKTPLIAACRAIVAAKLGDAVSVPAELVQQQGEGGS